MHELGHLRYFDIDLLKYAVWADLVLLLVAFWRIVLTFGVGVLQ
jgi:hypothetical protein